jgi:hypothetical protein
MVDLTGFSGSQYVLVGVAIFCFDCWLLRWKGGIQGSLRFGLRPSVEMTWLVIVVGVVAEWRFYFPPFAVRLRRMGHPSGVVDDDVVGFCRGVGGGFTSHPSR